MSGRVRVPPHVTMDLMSRHRWRHRSGVIGGVVAAAALIAAIAYVLKRGPRTESELCAERYAAAQTMADTLRVDSSRVAGPPDPQLGERLAPTCRLLRAP